MLILGMTFGVIRKWPLDVPDCFETKSEPASAWIRLGELQAQEIACLPYHESALKDAVQTIRSLTTKEPECIYRRNSKCMRKVWSCASTVPELKKVPGMELQSGLLRIKR